jgi:glycosyltransferase involved in cell wall biosynthesis
MVGISILTLVPGLFGGSATYARELTRALARSGTLDYRVFAPTLAPDAGDGLPTTTVTAYRASRTSAGRLKAMALATAMPAPVRRQLELERLDGIHFALTVMVPKVDYPPALTTVHDVLHLVHPSLFSRPERVYRHLVYRRLARESRLLLVPSEHAKEVLVERLSVEPERVRVIHHGLDHERFRPRDEPREPFLLYPAERYRHKNHERLFAAFALLRRERPELTLVLTGYDPDGRPAPPGVEERGRVSVDELAGLYGRASALVFPSLHEVFGLPPLEAMASGCPVATSTAGALTEICGEAAGYFDPYSAESIAAAVIEVLDRPEGFVARGLVHATGFSWETCAREHEAVYRELREAGGRGRRRPSGG